MLWFNDYGWKSGIQIEWLKIIAKHSRWPEKQNISISY